MIDFKIVTTSSPVIAWWSGGVTSAIACWLSILWFGLDKVVIVFIGTNNEDDDTDRFKKDCEQWYGKKIDTITNKNYDSIQEVWEEYLSLNVATGAICSAVLKRKVRQDYQNKFSFSYQVFGFDVSETNRAVNMKRNYPDSKPIFPLIYAKLSKKDSLNTLQQYGIEPPITYRLGFSNNNCFKTGCVQGGVGYWQKIQREFTDKFEAMAKMEHDLTDKKGEPVTICKDQSKDGGLVFLKPHPKYPNIKDISMLKGRMPEPLMECNGFCNDKK